MDLYQNTSLEVEGEEIGVNLKWFKSKIPTFVGKKAYWKVLLAKMMVKTLKFMKD
jgi:hypothetical protein